MTNFEYIKQNMTEIDFTYCLFADELRYDERPNVLADRIYEVWHKWAESASPNKGNRAKGRYGDHEVTADPSIWLWEMWHYPDGKRREKGRSLQVSFLVWLSLQYKPEEWE